MKHMAEAYRATAAQLSARIEEKRRSGAPEYEIHALKKTLAEIRMVQRTLDGYYITPRAPEITSAGWYAKKGKSK